MHPAAAHRETRRSHPALDGQSTESGTVGPFAGTAVRGRGREPWQDWALAAVLLLFGVATYAIFIVQDYSGPLIGGPDYEGDYRGDANYYEFLSYYVRDHYHFGLKPISFFTTDVAYPFGTHIGRLSWCAERDLFNALMLTLFGRGPWMQLHATLGTFIGAVGVTAVLRRELGVKRASLVGFAASYFAFYAWYKYPYHVNLTAIHWVSVGMALDAVFMRKVARGERLGAIELTLRFALVTLAMGLDLGYVAGFTLTSVVITLYFCWSELGLRDRRLVGRFTLLWPKDIRAEVSAAPLAAVGTCIAALLGLLVYIPFALAVVRDTATYPMTGAIGTYWASPFHLLFPYLPGLHPASWVVKTIFGRDEGVGEYAPGYTLVAAAGIAIWLSRKRDSRPVFAPHLVMALAIVAYHPRWSKTLQVFPWFAYFRVAGRGTLVLPTILAIIAASALNWPKRATRIVGALAIAEFATATLCVSGYKPGRLNAPTEAYFATIKHSPGKGLLDWPLCIASATGSITRELCPYFNYQSTTYANRRFHEKSTVGTYLSYVHPSQFATWLNDGWADMFMPNDPNREHPTRELRCFSDEQWQRFDALYTGYDFAGIQLYLDLLPDECVETFHRRYGPAVANTTLARGGRVEFIPRKPAAASGP